MRTFVSNVRLYSSPSHFYSNAFPSLSFKRWLIIHTLSLSLSFTYSQKQSLNLSLPPIPNTRRICLHSCNFNKWWDSLKLLTLQLCTTRQLARDTWLDTEWALTNALPKKFELKFSLRIDQRKSCDYTIKVLNFSNSICIVYFKAGIGFRKMNQ